MFDSVARSKMGLFDEISQNITKKVTFLTWAGINFGVAVGCSITTITAAAMKKKKRSMSRFSSVEQ